jgi:hypothetical protein
MPFREHWSAVVFDHLCRSLSALDWKPIRADFSYANPDALAEVWQLICQSELVVADITGATPNVMYELGLCHVIAKPTIVLRQTSTKTPFNIATRRNHSYTIENDAVIGLDRKVLGEMISALLRSLDPDLLDNAPSIAVARKNAAE